MSLEKFVLCFSLIALPLATSAHAKPDPKAASPADKARAEIKGAFGFVPDFFNAVPEVALPGAWAEMAGFQMGADTKLPGKAKELIGLAVAAQVPCHYCIYAHTEFAKLGGASNDELREAVAMSALTRHWSTFLNGTMIDEAAWRADVDKWVAHAKNPPKTMATPAPADPVKAEVQAAFGSVPDFINRFPKSGLAGAWSELRDLELNPKTALDGKTKSLIGVAVAAQIPCRYCLIADSAFARLAGASQDEIDEAITMSSIVRHWSTVLNGMQVDMKGFQRDVDRIVAHVKKSQVQ